MNIIITTLLELLISTDRFTVDGFFFILIWINHSPEVLFPVVVPIERVN